MFSKIRTITLAVAAVAAVSAASLATSTSADARGFGGGGFHGGGHIGGTHLGGGQRLGGGLRLGGGRIGHPGIGIKFRPGIKIGHRWPHRHFCHYSWNRCGIHVRWHRPWIYGVGVAAAGYAVAPTVAATPAPSCTCLTKQYTPDNLVVFQDVCTKEVASAPVGNTQVQLQAPVQQQ